MKLEINGLQKSFGTHTVLNGATITLQGGRIYGLLGRNGSGKTTLFNCLSGEMQCQKGTAVFTDDSGNSRPLAPSDICYVLSTPMLPEFFTGYEYISFYCGIHKVTDHTPDEYLDIVGITADERHRLIKGYSHGMKNKLQMLGFIISRPPVLLLDEPLTNLDPVVSMEIKKLLIEFAKEHIVIFSTHILELAKDLCDDIVLLTGGKLEQVAESALHSNDFAERIVEILKDDADGENDEII